MTVHALRRDDDPHSLHLTLSAFGRQRLTPAMSGVHWQDDIAHEARLRLLEGHFVERERAQAHAQVRDVPTSAGTFIAWYEALRDSGPGQHDPLFPWLAGNADRAAMGWFVEQEAASEAGFDDLVALTQVKLPTRAKLELARNYWDEMGRGNVRGMHGPMLAALVHALALTPRPQTTVWESLALGNLMTALASNRRYAFQSVGALGVIEMTAPDRAQHVARGLARLGLDKPSRRYFELHAVLDRKHSQDWNREVIVPLIEADPDLARPIAEGALMRLNAGARCFERYHREFGLS